MPAWAFGYRVHRDRCSVRFLIDFCAFGDYGVPYVSTPLARRDVCAQPSGPRWPCPANMMPDPNGTNLPVTTFAELGLSPKVLAAVTEAGYTTPTPIQAGAIPHALAGKDVLGVAQTGTGKTAAFVLPMITRLERGRARARMPRTLILEPTRELAAQVEENFIKYGANNKLSVALLIGGVSFEDQNRKLERGVDVLIATPGRLLDHSNAASCFDRRRNPCDRRGRPMLDMGFIPDIERICKMIPFNGRPCSFRQPCRRKSSS